MLRKEEISRLKEYIAKGGTALQEVGRATFEKETLNE
jgi:hypothetical protein